MRKKRGLITREKPDFRDYLKNILRGEGFETESIETPFKKGFPDLIAFRKHTWFLELKWLGDQTGVPEGSMMKILQDKLTYLQDKWLREHASFSRKISGKQVYGAIGGYYQDGIVKLCFIHYIDTDIKSVSSNFKKWVDLDSIRGGK